MTQDIQFMMNRFPTFKDQILQAYENNEEFKSLCEDFYSSALILINSKNKVLKDRKSDLEYQKLFLDLETEILNFLSATDNIDNMV